MNLSREYFNSLASSSDFGDEEKEFHQSLQEEITKTSNVLESQDGKGSDGESGVTPFTHEESPIKGIIKKTSDVRQSLELKSLKGLFRRASLAHAIPWLAFVVVIFMGHEMMTTKASLEILFAKSLLVETDPSMFFFTESFF